MYNSPDFNRIRLAVNHQESDRVPLCEDLIEYPVQSQFLGREVTSTDIEAQVEFWTKAGYDFIPLTVGMMEPGKLTKDSVISNAIQNVLMQDTSVSKESDLNIERLSLINSRADFEKFPWEIVSKFDFYKFDSVKSLLPNGMKVIALSGKIFTLSWMLMGFNNFAISLIIDENLVADVIRKVAEIQFQALENIYTFSHVGAIWAIDDLAFSSGPIISPQALRDHILPYYRSMAELCHKNDLLFFLHSDGDLVRIMEDIIDIGIDALHPIDPTCMNIFETKKIYGDKICLIGNVSTELLRVGTTSEVKENVKQLITKLAIGGGFCLGSGNSIPSWVRYENFLAMREANIEYGHYPIVE